MTVHNEDNQKYKYHVAVIVLGDVGRSPRMQYHALSLLQNECQVSLIGYDGEDLIPDLTSYEMDPNSNQLHVVRFSTNKRELNKFQEKIQKIPVVGKIWYYMMRVLSLIYMLYHALWVQLDSIPNCLLIQNPPSIPLLLMTYIYCHSHSNTSSNENKNQSVTRPGLVIDWHNLGYTMFGYTSPYHPIRFIAKQYEKILAPKADAHLCVTHAMKDYLITEQFVKSPSSFPTNTKYINVLHDRPPEFFHKCNTEEIHNLMIRYQNDFSDCFVTHYDNISNNEKENNTRTIQPNDEIVEQTLFTIKKKKKTSNNTITTNSIEFEYKMKQNRPALLVSSTSWTPDEDFNILLNALLSLEQMIQSRCNSSTEKDTECKDKYSFPKIVVTVTGKGPQKEHYQKLIHSINPTLTYISIQTLWLSSSDYPLFIGSADLGISLHTSTSGIDLPMKVLDMMGCEVPVCAINFKCLPELIKDGRNGKIFENEQELANILFDIFGKDKNGIVCGCNGWDVGRGVLNDWREGIGRMTRWKENWNSEAKHIIFGACDIPYKIKYDFRLFFFIAAINTVLVAIVIPYFY